MKMSLAFEIFAEAEELKASLAEEKTNSATAITARQKIQGRMLGRERVDG